MPRPRPRFVLPESVDIPGLGCTSAEAPFVGLPGDEALRVEAALAGLALGDGADVVTLTPGTAATAAALESFVEASNEVQGDVVGRLAPPYDAFCETPAFGSPARLIRLRGGGTATPERIAEATAIDVDVDGQRFDVPLLDRAGGRQASLHASTAVVVNRSQWPGVVWSNLLALGPTLLRTLPGPPGIAPARVAWAALRAGSIQPDAVGRRLVRREANVEVHPAAVVEGTWLMDGASVDAGAVVRHSIVGPGARIEPQALVVGSVIGPNAVIQRRGFVSYGVVAQGAGVGGKLQLGLVGPNAQLKVGAILLDQALDAPVRASIDGELVEVPFDLLGAAIGAESIVGAAVYVAAGRLVPAGVLVVAGGEAVLVRPSAAEPGRYRVVGGSLEPC